MSSFVWDVELIGHVLHFANNQWLDETKGFSPIQSPCKPIAGLSYGHLYIHVVTREAVSNIEPGHTLDHLEDEMAPVTVVGSGFYTSNNSASRPEKTRDQSTVCVQLPLYLQLLGFH